MIYCGNERIKHKRYNYLSFKIQQKTQKWHLLRLFFSTIFVARRLRGSCCWIEKLITTELISGWIQIGSRPLKVHSDGLRLSEYLKIFTLASCFSTLVIQFVRMYLQILHSPSTPPFSVGPQRRGRKLTWIRLRDEYSS